MSANPHAEAVLQNLARNCYFMTRLDDDAETHYEIHPLLRRQIDAVLVRSDFRGGSQSGDLVHGQGPGPQAPLLAAAMHDRQDPAARPVGDV